MTRNDKTWAQVNRKTPVLGNKPNETRYSFPPITYLNKQNNVLRFCKAVHIYLTTFYSWKNSWHAAAR